MGLRFTATATGQLTLTFLITLMLVSCNGNGIPVPAAPRADLHPIAAPVGTAGWPDALPADYPHPGEALDNGGMVPATGGARYFSREASIISVDSEVRLGYDTEFRGGDVADVGDALALSSGLPGDNEVSFAVYRLPLGGSQPGVVAADVNLRYDGSGNLSRYWLGVADYDAGRWQWHGPFSESHGRVVLPSGNYSSDLGSTYVSMLCCDGANFDVVAVGVSPVDPVDTTPPGQPGGLTATAVADGAELQWNLGLAADIAGYRIYHSNSSFIDEHATGVSVYPSLINDTRYLLSGLGTTHTYIRIAAVDLTGNQSPLSDEVVVDPLPGTAPQVELVTDTVSGVRGITANLTANGAESYDWDLDGDGSIDIAGDTTGTMPATTTSAGFLRPLVRGVSGSGELVGYGAVSMVITTNARPLADGVASQTQVTVGDPVDFNGTGVDDDGEISNYEWDFEGDGTYDYSDPAIAATSHSYAAAGLYNAKFRVTDNDGAMDVDTISVLVSSGGANAAPSASFDFSPVGGTAPVAIDFDASTSSDADGSIVVYYWDWDNDGEIDSATADPVNAHTFTDPGSYTVTLTVQDDGGAVGSTDQFVSINAPPVGYLDAHPLEVYPGETITLSADGSYDGDGSIAAYTFYVNGLQVSSGTDNFVVYTPAEPGYLQFQVALEDDDGAFTSVVLEGGVAKGWIDYPLTEPDSSNYGIGISLATVNAVPAVAYTTLSHGLRFGKASGTDGTSWSLGTVINNDPGMLFDEVIDMEVINGHPAVLWQDATNYDVEFSYCSGIYGYASWNTYTIQSADEAGYHLDLEMVDGYPAAAYYSFGTDGYLSYAQGTNDPSSWMPPVVVDTTTSADVGDFCDLEVVNGNPAIVYQDFTNMNAMYVRATASDGSTWGAPVVVATANIYDVSLAVVDGCPAVIARDSGPDNVEYIRADDKDGSSWPGSSTTIVVNDCASLGNFEVINGYPAFAYLGVAPYKLKYIQALDAHGGSWAEPVLVDDSVTYDLPVELLEVNGCPAIAARDNTNSKLVFFRKY